MDNGTGCAPLVVQFFDNSEGDVDSWNWSFPGGTPDTSAEQDPLVVYENPGTYDVTLEVTNSAGSNSITYVDYILINEPVFASFNFLVNDSIVTFINTTQNAAGLVFQWDFGDGITSDQTNPMHTYSQPGVYLVTLVVTNPFCGSAFSQNVAVLSTNTKTIDLEKRIEVFPNPVTDILTIKSEIQPEFIKISNALGQQVLELKTQKSIEQIDVSNLQSGIYVIHFLVGEVIFATEFVKL